MNNVQSYGTLSILGIIGLLVMSLVFKDIPKDNIQIVGNIVTGLFGVLTGGAAVVATNAKSPPKDPTQ